MLNQVVSKSLTRPEWLNYARIGLLVLCLGFHEGLVAHVWTNAGAQSMASGCVEPVSGVRATDQRKRALEFAVHSFQMAFALEPEKTRAAENLAKAFVQQGNLMRQLQEWDGAIASYEHANGINPQSPEGYAKIGETLIYQKAHSPESLALAVRMLNAAVSKAPPNAYYRILLGHAYWYSGRGSEAVRELVVSVELAAGAYNLGVLGDFHMASGRVDAAIDCYKRSLTYERTREEVWISLGRAYASSGDRENAIGAWQEALALIRDDQVARIVQANIDAWK